MRILSPMFVIVCVWPAAVKADNVPETPRIDSVVMSRPQPPESDPAVIWYDDFDGPAKPYTESQGNLDAKEAFGGQGRSMLGLYEKGSQGAGNRKVFFGDSPTGKAIVWRSNLLAEPDHLRVGPETGQFLGQLAGRDRLAASHTYYVRLRQQSDTGQESPWSPWHQPIRTEEGKP